MKFDKDITKIKRVTFVLRHSVVVVYVHLLCIRQVIIIIIFIIAGGLSYLIDSSLSYCRCFSI